MADIFAGANQSGSPLEPKRLLIIGLLALSYVGFALLDARLYQAEQARRFERALRKRTSRAPKALPSLSVKVLRWGVSRSAPSA